MKNFTTVPTKLREQLRALLIIITSAPGINKVSPPSYNVLSYKTEITLAPDAVVGVERKDAKDKTESKCSTEWTILTWHLFNAATF